MNYISLKEASQLWGISVSRIGLLIRNGRIPGAKLIGNGWLIPKGTKKPIDKRTKAAKENANTTLEEQFRFPFFVDFEIESYSPSLTDEELQLRHAQLLFYECRFEEAKNALADLPNTAKNRYVQISALFYACLISQQYSGQNHRYVYFNKFKSMLSEDFPYKKEMLFLQYSLDSYNGNDKNSSNEFCIDSNYSYHDSLLPLLLSLSTYCLCISSIRDSKKTNLSMYELICDILGRKGYIFESQAIHIYLGVIYSLQSNQLQAREHFKKAFVLAKKHKLYWLPALYYSYIGPSFTEVLSDFPDKFAKKIACLGNDIHKHYVEFSKSESIDTIYSVLSKNDYQYIAYALQGLSNKKIAAKKNLSEVTVSKRYSEIYAKLGVSNKSELKEFFLESFNVP